MNSPIEVTVRQALPEEEDSVEELIGVVFQGNRRFYRPKATATPISKDDSIPLLTCVACCDDKFVGVMRYWSGKDCYFIGDFGVHPDFQNEGIGKKLLRYVTDNCIDRRFDLFAKTIKEAGAVPIYERYGFQVINEKPSKWAEGPNGEVVMETSSIFRGQGLLSSSLKVRTTL